MIVLIIIRVVLVDKSLVWYGEKFVISELVFVGFFLGEKF